MFNIEASLEKNVGQSSFGQSLVLRHKGTKGLFSRSFFEGDVASLLPQFDESSALEGAHQALAGDAWQLWHLSGDFDNRPEGLLLGGAVLGPTPGFEVKLDRFAKIRPRGLDVFTLRGYIEFGAASHIQIALFRD